MSSSRTDREKEFWEENFPKEEELFCQLRYGDDKQRRAGISVLWSFFPLFEKRLKHCAASDLRKRSLDVTNHLVDECYNNACDKFTKEITEGKLGRPVKGKWTYWEWEGPGTIFSILRSCINSVAMHIKNEVAKEHELPEDITNGEQSIETQVEEKEIYQQVCKLAIDVSKVVIRHLEGQVSKKNVDILIMWFYIGLTPEQIQHKISSDIHWGRVRKLKIKFANLFIRELIKVDTLFAHLFVERFEGFLQGDKSNGDLNAQHHVVQGLRSLVEPRYDYDPQSKDAVEKFIKYLDNKSPL